MRISRRSALLTLPCLLVLQASLAHARPEYATSQKLDCTACHVTPWGGGPRTVTGKTYGSHGYPPARTSQTDLFYGDLRFIGYFPVKKYTPRTQGVAVMQAAATANVPITQGEGGSEMRGVLTYNIASLGGANLREAYLRLRRGSADDTRTPVHVTIGRFYPPFGLLTDEHRTYTRIQTQSTINNYAVGGALSAETLRGLHADLALVNDFQTGGTFTTNDITWGAVANLRWNPATLPFLLGGSANYQRTQQGLPPFATSVYGVLSADRLTGNALSASLSLERVDAKNWNNPALNPGQVNPGLSQFFVPQSDPAYVASIRSSRTTGYYLWARYFPVPQFSLIYKFDFLDLDRESPDDDRHRRHGIGFEAYLNSNLALNARYEFANIGRPRTAGSSVLAAQNDVFAMLRLWL